MKKNRPQFIAIVGGSGSGKTWLADRLGKSFGKKVARISLDDFYRDRSHLSVKQRNQINFDHPRAIDWKNVERVLNDFAAGRAVRTPKYNFTTHAREEKSISMKPKPLIIMDGLWLLRRPVLRRLFSCRIFVDCPGSICLRRRLERDLAERGRDASAVRKQFLKHVLPMQERFVASQLRWANVVIKQPSENQISQLTEQLKTILKTNNYERTAN